MDKEKFAQTALALENLNAALAMLKHSVGVKKNALGQQRQSYKRNMVQKNARLESIDRKTETALSKIADVVTKIDMVLKDDGSDNNHD